MCGTLFSYKSGDLLKKTSLKRIDSPEILKINDWDSIFDVYKNNINIVDRIYFAGGEPLIIPEHLDILNLLLENKKTNVYLYYNSNCSNFTYKGVFFPDIWKQFDRVEINASVDAEGATLEYMRYGSDWNKIYENLKELKKYPNIIVSFNIVVTFFNLNNVPILVDILEDLIEEPRITFNIARGRDDLGINLVPKEYVDFKSWISLLDRGYNCNLILNEMDKPETIDKINLERVIYFMDKFKEETGKDAKDIISYYDEVIKKWKE